MTITNTGASDLFVSNVTIGGTNPNQFALASGQPTSFSVPAGQTATVSAQFTATTAFGMKVATMTIASNDPLVPNYQVSLRGFNAGGTVGDTEPGFQDLMTTLGYSTSTGINGTYQATTRAPVGDEIIAPYFKRVDTDEAGRALPDRPLRRRLDLHLGHGVRTDQVLGQPHQPLQVPGGHRRRGPRATAWTPPPSSRTRS